MARPPLQRGDAGSAHGLPGLARRPGLGPGGGAQRPLSFRDKCGPMLEETSKASFLLLICSM